MDYIPWFIIVKIFNSILTDLLTLLRFKDFIEVNKLFLLIEINMLKHNTYVTPHNSEIFLKFVIFNFNFNSLKLPKLQGFMTWIPLLLHIIFIYSVISLPLIPVSQIKA